MQYLMHYLYDFVHFFLLSFNEKKTQFPSSYPSFMTVQSGNGHPKSHKRWLLQASTQKEKKAKIVQIWGQEFLWNILFLPKWNLESTCHLNKLNIMNLKGFRVKEYKKRLSIEEKKLFTHSIAKARGNCYRRFAY